MLVICCGMVRSGSTLQYNIVRKLVEEAGNGRGEGWFAGRIRTRSIERTLENDRVKLEAWAADNDFHVIKTHHLPEWILQIGPVSAWLICFTFRDIRDIAASAKIVWGLHGETLFQQLDEAIDVYYRLNDLPPSNVLMQKYEAMVQNLPGAIKRHATFLDLNLADSEITKLTHELALDSTKRESDKLRRNVLIWLKKLSARFGLYIPTHDEKTLLHQHHISQHEGKSGIWKNHFSAEEQEVFTSRYKEWLSLAGYKIQ